MRKDKLYIAFLIFAVVLYAVVEILKPKPINWSNDFTRSSSIPYGAEILYDELEILFPNSDIDLNDRSVYSFYDENSTLPRNWIFINDQFQFDPLETEELLYSAEQGGQIFISGVIQGKLADTLNLEYDYFYSLMDSVSNEEQQTVTLADTSINRKDGWGFSKETSFYHITSYDTSKTEELGYWNVDQLNFVRITWGEGYIYLNSTPHLYSNYYLRNPELATYAFTTLSYLPVQETIWDSYYKAGRKVAGTPMSVIISNNGLKHGWYLAILTLLLFMIFKAKREQRIIPIIKPPINSSIQFAETIGELYLEQGSHREILNKKLKFFYEYINQHLQLDVSRTDEKFKTDLAYRSGIEKQEIHKLIDLIELSGSSGQVSQSELKLITEKIDEFYKQSQR
jgi:hypothetical protein